MTSSTPASSRPQLGLRPASLATRWTRVLYEGLVYGAAYAIPTFFATSPKRVDPEWIWHFCTCDRTAIEQGFVDHWPPAPFRRRIIKGFLDQTHAEGIEYHYDVSNAFYALFLDRDYMFYTCADFNAPTDTIEDAQRNKANHILGLLDPRPGEKIIELGCGWGGMLKHISAAIGDGSNLSGLTLSRDQVDYIRTHLGFSVALADLITHDYGTETYDKIYAIGALEHVRPDSILPLFQRLHAALKPGGRMVQHFFSLNGTDPVPPSMLGAQAYFPGSILSLHSDIRAKAERAGFRIAHDSAHDYRPTLRAWFDRLVENRDQAEALVGHHVVNKYFVYFAMSWRFFDLKQSTLHRLVLMKD
ncbi:class I SAM-dependent methyltransferase [Phreatobacter sp.]|uniref:class I SAM-dependent methyltransferase n=1 Tax=Phreatobacter sp. TaxID=1966341 RepID=UPI0022CBDFA6|nr:class I SAM-dependent methyltransferase [Phreatobacter sp.]MCZ8316548.1 class I SAM-dependent methyltransferase [Phreatobacter sp.]